MYKNFIKLFSILLILSSPALAMDEELKTLKKEVAELTIKITGFETALQYILPSPINSSEDLVIRGFKDRLQSHLTGYFGAYKVESSGLFQRSKPSAFLAVEVGASFISCIPKPVVGSTVDALVKVGNAVYENYQEKTDSKHYHVFASFAAIDKASYLVAHGVSEVYSPQIKKLTYDGAIELADSAAHTLKWFIANRAEKDNLEQKNKVIMIKPDELLLALGKYYKPKNSELKSSGNVHSYCKKMGTTEPRKHFCDLDIFLASGLQVGTELYNNCLNPYLYENKFWDITDKHFVYTAAPGKSLEYEYRMVSNEYRKEMESYLNKRGRKLELRGSSQSSDQDTDEIRPPKKN